MNLISSGTRVWTGVVWAARTMIAGAVVLAVIAMLSLTPASGAPIAVNPLRPVAPDDVTTDPSHGFLVLIEGDAELNENETEGPVAIGGNVRFRDYRVGLNDPGTYVLPGDTQPTSLVIGSRPDFADSTAGGSLSVLNQSYAKIGDLSTSDVLMELHYLWNDYTA